MSELANDCDCLKNLDELRIRHEKGEIDAFVIIVEGKEGTFVWGHKADYLAALVKLGQVCLDAREKHDAG